MKTWKYTSPPKRKKLKDLSAEKRPRGTDELVEDTMAGYFDEVRQIRETLDSRYDDLKTGRVKPVRGEEVIARLRAKSAAYLKRLKESLRFPPRNRGRL